MTGVARPAVAALCLQSIHERSCGFTGPLRFRNRRTHRDTSDTRRQHLTQILKRDPTDGECRERNLPCDLIEQCGARKFIEHFGS